MAQAVSAFIKRFNVTAMTRDKLYDITQGTPGSRIIYFTSNPQDIIEELKQKMSDDYPALDDIDYSIKYVSEALCDYASPAMYFMPQLDNPDINSIYINKTGTTDSYIFPTLAHEGYPGS